MFIFNRKYINSHSFIHGEFSSMALLVIQDVIHEKQPFDSTKLSLFFVGEGMSDVQSWGIWWFKRGKGDGYF